MSKKLLYYVTSFWNLLDLSGLTLFIVGLILRLTALHFGSDSIDSDAKRRMIEWAHTSYVFSLVIYYVRLTHTCSVSQQLGPKIIMIAKMVSIQINVKICGLLGFVINPTPPALWMVHNILGDPKLLGDQVKESRLLMSKTVLAHLVVFLWLILLIAALIFSAGYYSAPITI